MSVSPAAVSIMHALRVGTVPDTGLELFATGLDALTEVVCEELDFVATGQGKAKWIRGEYGTGKTFAVRYLCAQARRRGFATSEFQISINDTPLHRLETVYRRLVQHLETAADGQNAFQAILDGWLYQVGDEVMQLQGIGEHDPNFAAATEKRLEDKLAQISRRNNAFARGLRAYHNAMHHGDLAAAQGLLSWLAGQPHTSPAVLRAAGLRAQVDSEDALAFLAGLLQLLRDSGYQGLVVVLDEVETIQRMNATTRAKALEALRQLTDQLAANQLPGLYLMVTGTRDFYETHRGIKSLAALYQRVQVNFSSADARFDNLRAPQIRLTPFDAARLLTVGRRIRDLFPARVPERIAERVDDAFLRGLIDNITQGFGGQVAVAPRLFLRELVDILDRVDQYDAYWPREHYQLEVHEDALTPEELAAHRGQPLAPPAEDDEADAPEDAPAEAPPEAPPEAPEDTRPAPSPGTPPDSSPEPPPRRRLDG